MIDFFNALFWLVGAIVCIGAAAIITINCVHSSWKTGGRPRVARIPPPPEPNSIITPVPAEIARAMKEAYGRERREREDVEAMRRYLNKRVQACREPDANPLKPI
jgi:hypothetical protein